MLRKDERLAGRGPDFGEQETRCLCDNGLVFDTHADRPAGRPAVVSSLGAFPHHDGCPPQAGEREYLTPGTHVSSAASD